MTENNPQAAPESTAPPKAPAPVPSGRAVSFLDQHEVYIDQALPRYAPPGVVAYRARTGRGVGALALVCGPRVIPRLHAIEKFIGLQSLTLPRLVARGILDLPDGSSHFTLLYEQNWGAPLVPHQGEALQYGMKPDVVLQSILKPIYQMLQEVHNADLIHGGIRADNLYDGGTQPLQRVVIGDHLSTSYLSAQPSLYLPPYLAAAQTMGRGLGTKPDDLYALGVTLAVLMRSHDPLSGKTEQQILHHKLEYGTLSTLIESERLPSNMLELLRGLLHDDPESRWTIKEIGEWLENKRTTHRGGQKKLKGSRHIFLSGEKILLPSMLALMMPDHINDAHKLIESTEIKQWIRRSVSDARLDQHYDEAIEGIQEGASVSHQADRLVARVACALEPFLPIAYRSVRSFPESFGLVLAEMMMLDRDVGPMADLINDQLVAFWMNMQHELPADFNMIINKFEQCQQFLRQKTIGYGIERCVYFLAPDVHCLSPYLRQYYVYQPEDLLLALNRLADQPQRPERILDRHMVAFLSIRDRKLVDRFLPDLGSGDQYRHLSGMMGIVGATFSRAKMDPLPGLTRWFHTLAGPLYERFHDRDERARMVKKMQELKDTGHVAKVVDLLLDPERQRRDQYDYRAATHDYYQLSLEKRQLQDALKLQHRFGTQAGREMAALFAGVIMSLAVAGFVLIYMTHGALPWP